MNKLATFILIMSGLVLLFYFAGLLSECDADGLCNNSTPTSKLLDILLKPENVQSSEFWGKAIAVLSLAGLGALVVGIFTRNLEFALYIPLGLYILNLMMDFNFVFNKVRSVNPVMAIIIFGPLMMLFVLTAVDWLRRHD